MDSQNFKTIIKKLRNQEISNDVAEAMLNALKSQKAGLSYLEPAPEHFRTVASNEDRSTSNGIAIIGMAGQFPDANNIDTFWKNLIQGHDAIHEFPAHYLDPSPNYDGKNQLYKWGGFLEERDCFDPLFFNISPREAESMNPHQRLILQESWKALEDAGYNPKKLADSQLGIFIGAEPSGYVHESFTGSSDAIVASRLSYYLDLKGPAIVVNTGCSSSGVAIHLACESLRTGESEIAIAGGVYANLSQNGLNILLETGMLSPTGRCCTFDESGDGTVLTEGVGIVVLKRLSDAIRAGDQIYGVIQGSGMNQDGFSNGITAPNGVAQEQLITSVYKRYDINPEDITYVEAHGTGTKLGDPVEANALVRAFKQFTNRKHYCVIGSAKANIGHTTAAAGVIGLIKVLLSIRHHQIPGFIHFKKLNPLIEFEESAFCVSTKVLDWRSKNGKPLMAALNSFGHSGTNVHLVIQEYIAPDESSSNAQIFCNEDNPVLIPLSAKNKERLKEYAGKFLEFLKNSTSGEVNLATNPQVYEELQDTLEQRILMVLSEILRVNATEIEINEKFQEYGVEQTHMLQLFTRLQEELGIEIQAQELLVWNSIEEIALYFLEHHSKYFGSNNSVLPVNNAVSRETERNNMQKPVPNLASMAYTLQTGREAMDERVVFLVSNIPELIIKLEAFIEGREEIKNCWQGQAKQGKNADRLFNSDEDIREVVKKWVKGGKTRKIAELWAQGFTIDWELIYGEAKPQRISLPTYPFAKESYWIPEDYCVSKTGCKPVGMVSSSAAFANSCPLHPLLHQNTSDLSEQRFSSIFTGEEFLLADHVVEGRRVLPEAACLEMAWTAVKQAMGALAGNQTWIRLKKVVWDRPIVIKEQPIPVHIGLFPEDNGVVSYEIYSESADNDEPILHCQGRAELIAATVVPTLDPKGIQAQCIQNCISSTELYEAFRATGINYGPGYQAIETVYVGQNQVLAKLSLPSSVSYTKDSFILHPSIMVAALQAMAGFVKGFDNLAPITPATLHELEIFGKCTSSMWALLQYNNEGNEAGDKSWVQRLDIDLCDEQGTVRVRIKGLETQVKADSATFEISSQNPLAAITQEAYELMTFEEIRQEETLPEALVSVTSPNKPKFMVCFLSNPENQQVLVETIRTHDQQPEIIFISQSVSYQKQTHRMYNIVRSDGHNYHDAFESIGEDVRQYLGDSEIDAILYLWPLEDSSCIQDYSCMVHILHTIASTKLKVKRVLFTAHFQNGLEQCYLESWIGFERSLGMVLPNTQVAVVYQAAQELNRETMEDWVRKLRLELQTPKVQSVLYQDGKRYLYVIRPTKIPSSSGSLKLGGTYLITGGCGGLGLLFAKHLAELSTKTQPVNLILTGRSPIDAEKQSKIKMLEDLGSKVIYIQADVCDLSLMKKDLNQAKERFGGINGVFHAAGIVGNQSIFTKEIQDVQMVLDPKIKGTLVLDELLKAEPLDFICYFSSASAILGDFGSCDYAIANRFMVAYAYYRNQQLTGERPGRAVVINWPLWKDGGMGFDDDESTRMYLKSSGQRILESGEGLAVFDRIMAQSKTQHLILVGQPSRVHRFLGLTQEQPVTTSFVISDFPHETPGKTRGRRPEMKSLSLEQCLEWDLKEQISQLLKISRDKLDRDENLADFGFDSISLAQLANILTKYYGIEITPSLFFGFSTIERLVQYFLTEHQEEVEAFYREDVHAAERPAGTSPPQIPVAGVEVKQRLRRSRFTVGYIRQDVLEPIAIIGMSGRFPEARNIDELWTILINGQDVVKEISLERFDWRRYHDLGISFQCGWIPGVSEFEPLFFEISPKEAETMDPRQRLLLQEAWKALEDAGYGTDQLKREKIGMFVGVEKGDYQSLAKEGGITSNNNAILAARLAYFLNLNGPVMAIDTACSSGLVAVHQAVLSLRNGECDTAIAAGVNLMLTPESFIGISQAGMLSEDGKCYAFDKRANGMVPGEAVAVVVLKRLAQAETDGDPVYAIIKGSGINYDGKTNGITAPSGVSQSNLLKSIYEQYRVNPEDIEYIVTHGTGTKLGDPVEINALYDVFKGYTRKQGYCALTSTKTNFGHTFAASGLVSLISLVQALRYELIPASLHCEQENDYIKWKESPFYVNITNKAWPAWNGKKRTGTGVARLGAVSAFGMSGTNAHIVVQSYVAVEDVTCRCALREQAPYYLLALSAKTEESLREKIRDIIEVLRNSNIQEHNLAQISYTLLEGRQHFNHRCAVVIQDREDALYVLKQADGREKLPNLFQGKVPGDFRGQKAIEQYVQDLLWQTGNLKENKNKYQEILYALADFYCQGYSIDWKQLYDGVKPQRIHLPTYPFVREQYWAPKIDTQSGSMTTQIISDRACSYALNPLLHQNTSDFSEQRFSSTFTGREFFFRDHLVQGQRFLPGVAYLEMARAAVEATTGVLGEERPGIRLKNIVWIRPIVAGEQPIQVHIGLFPEDNGEIAYEIYGLPPISGSSGDNIEPLIYSQGEVVLNPVTENSSLDLSAIKAHCNQSSISAGECYDAFKTMGIDYGPAHRGIEMIYVGQAQVLARLALPASVSDTLDQFILHPSIMDSALQASLGLVMDSGELASFGDTRPHKPYLPFALQELEILGKMTSTMWVLIRYSNVMPGWHVSQAGSKAAEPARMQKLDIDLCDDQGTVKVRIKGFTTRMLEEQFKTGNELSVISGSSNEPLVGAIKLVPVWDAIPVEKGQRVPSPTDRVVVTGGTINDRRAIQQYYPQAQELEIKSKDTIETIANKFEAYGTVDHILWIAPHDELPSLAEDVLINQQDQGVLQVFRMIKALLHLGYGTRNLGWSVITFQAQPVHKNEAINPTHASLYGLMGSLAKEYQNWKIRLVDLEADSSRGKDWPLADVFSLPSDPQGEPFAYRGGEWYRQKLVPLRDSGQSTFTFNKTLYKTGGVYVVIGGAGGIGEAWSEYMIRTYQAQIVWIGRRPKDEVIQAKLDRLAIFGSSPRYITADATDRNGLQQAYEMIKAQYSRIHGVIHSAIVLLDQSLTNMTEERFRAGLSAKVDVSIRMAQVFHKEPLDFVMFYSSMQSFTKSPGQSNYASGCTFKDAFAHQLALEWPCTVKVMNWGYWGSIGIVASKAYQERMAQAGIGSIEPPEAMKALETLLTGPIDQIALMKTTKPFTTEGINHEEWMTVYPSEIPLHIQNIKDNSSTPTEFKNTLAISETGLFANEMEALLGGLLWAQLQSIGLFAERNSEISDDKTKIGLRDLYHRWLNESMAVLARQNYLQYDGKSITVIDPTPIDIKALWNEWEQKKGRWMEDPNMKAQVILVETTLKALTEILTGKVLATDIMFPNSTMELVEGIYKNNIVADIFNEALADIVVTYIEARLKQNPFAKMRIIEIGAGTGGTSTMVFRKINPYQAHIQEYCYTDISKAFLMHAETEYGPRIPYLTYQIFNVEEPIAGQGIEADKYDLVIATNVLHATKNIRQTIRNAKSVLKNSGLIILNEMSANSLFAHLTFGLLEGWWRYEDSGIRIPGCPALYPKTWQTVLEREGFRSVFFPAQAIHDMGQQIIIAESDGVVRQKQPRASEYACVKKPSVAPVIGREQPRNQAFKCRATESRVVQMQKTPIIQAEEITMELLREKSTSYLKKMIGETLKIPYHKIDSAEPFEKYGIDSILVVQLTNTLSKVIDNVNSTLFFEYQTIDALVEYLLKIKKDAFLTLLGLETQAHDQEISSDDEIFTTLPSLHSIPTFRQSRRFLQYHNPEITESISPPSLVKDIAIIGLAGRYPGAENIHEFWTHLKEGRNCITEIPIDRWDWKKYFDEEKGKEGTTYTKWGGFIKDIDKFDPLFFYISPKEAENMDPQERLFLEVAYSSIEDAGYTPATLCNNRKIGVFVGVMNGYYPTGVSYWSIANRVSYLLNFQGPSMAVDTACSSSLTAIHLALESLYSGISECAIAGGVNLIIDPIHYVKLSAMTMLSSSDKCKSFGDGADGIVDGEAVGAIVLKPLEKSIADGDHIYGIIKGSMLNAGGKTNGYTVPNPNAQYQLIAESLKRARVHARTISYLEAHGTGTSLGDPIEIAGLTRAFEQDTQDKQFCAIGSAKSNIGHCESAAGIAGVTKVLLQLKNRQLVPSLHSEMLNTNIDFSNTPFKVQQTLVEWKRLVIDGLELPRRAGVSSFGAGGSNAHIVIEEYISNDQEATKIPNAPRNPDMSIPAIIVLSAQNEERLLEQAQRLLGAIKERHFSDDNLADIAYTLQVGREAMEERLAMMVDSIKELEEKLRGFAEGQDGILDLHRGQAKGNKETLHVFATDEELREAVDKWIQRKKYGKLLDLWVKGLIFDWNKLYGNIKPRRISLPTYPFAKESYWIPERHWASEMDTQPGSTAINSTLKVYIHPLLHQNTSDLLEQRFSSTFTGREFFMADHMVNGQRVLPGVACLEMARAAVVQATGRLAADRTGIYLKNVVWDRPIVAGDQPIEVHIGLFPEQNGEIAYEIYSTRVCGELQEPGGQYKGSVTGKDDTESIIHNQGRAILHPITEIPVLDLRDVQTQCTRNSLSPTEIYQGFTKMGINYGPGYQGIDAIYKGRGQVLAKVSLPITLSNTKDSFILHPSIMDAALQVTNNLIMDLDNPKPIMPISMQELEIFGRHTSPTWVLIRYNEGVEAEDNLRVQKFDIDLCDEQGTVWARMKGMEIQENTETIAWDLENSSESTLISNTQEPYEMMTFEEIWQEEALPDEYTRAISPNKPTRLVCFLSNPENQQVLTKTFQIYDQPTEIIFISQSITYQKENRQMYGISRTDRNTYMEAFRSIRDDERENSRDSGVDAILYLWPLEDPGCIKDYSCIVYILQAMGATKLTAGRVQFAAQFQNALERCYLESWIGFERSLRLILPNTQVAATFQAQSSSETAMKDWFHKLRMELQIPTAQSVLYQEGKRYVSRSRQAIIKPGNNLLKPGGTYLITGGCGGLGLLFAEHLVEASSETGPLNLILTGRSPMDAQKQLKIKALEDLGSQVLYVQADVCNLTRMKKGLNQAKEHFGSINGIIHAAGIAGNQTIFENDFQNFKRVLEPKIKGTLVLDELLKAEPLDFVCYFSSTSAILGDFGSCDYSVANRFLMAFAHYRNQQQQKGERQGKTIVINWPLWKDGGMGFGDDDNTKMYLKSSGQRILEAREGLAVFDRILSQNGTQYLVLVGQPSRIHRFLGLAGGQSPQASPVPSSVSPNAHSHAHARNGARGRRPEMKGLSLEQCLEWDLKWYINRLLKIPRDKIDRGKNFADFGFNSIGLTQLAIQLIKHFGIDEITPALFFRYATIEKLTQYLVIKHQAVIEEFYREDAGIPASITAAIPPKKSIMPVAKRQALTSRVRTLRLVTRDIASSSVCEPVAIIGMSGRFPGARNIDELWAILNAGQNMVQEIPVERFDWRQYYGDPSKESDKINCKWCGCIPGVSEFEPLFFEISPMEAETMDPRQRLLLQESWRALEDAGYGAKQIKHEKIGMFVGVEQGDYQLLTRGVGGITSNNNAILASRLAYFLNLNGPVMAIDTACSSGLVATHQAVSSLRNGECDTAIAAGINLMLTPELFIGMSQVGMLSHDGKCHAFDQKANGMVPGEAVAVVVLKRLSQAKADGDPIYAIIKGSGINYDGKTNGITAPSGVSQTNLLKTIYEQHRLNPEEIEYIVTHGTGTRLGDPVEINALYDAFKDYTQKRGYCALTSTKTNFGHTFAASGLVSLISLVQALRYGIIPASLHCEEENDYILWKESPFYVNKTSRPWPVRDGKTRTGAVSAFGMSGTNAHMVVQSYSTEEGEIPRPGLPYQTPYYLLALSAKTEESLEEKIKDMVTVLENKANRYDMSQISYTLLEGRQHFNHRCAVVIQDRENAIYVLRQIGNKERIPNLFQGKVSRDFIGQKTIKRHALDLLKQSRTLLVNQSKYQEMLFTLADLYCQGYSLDWKLLFDNPQIQRIHLPAYPFTREHYWIRETQPQIKMKSPPLRNNVLFYDQLLDEIIDNSLSIDNAVEKTEKFIKGFSSF